MKDIEFHLHLLALSANSAIFFVYAFPSFIAFLRYSSFIVPLDLNAFAHSFSAYSSLKHPS